MLTTAFVSVDTNLTGNAGNPAKGPIVDGESLTLYVNLQPSTGELSATRNTPSGTITVQWYAGPVVEAFTGKRLGVMTGTFINEKTAVDDAVLNLIAHVPTEFLAKVADPAFFRKLSDRDFMRIGTLLARKSYDEGGCPIGGVIIDSARQIIGKGHNTLGQENDSTTHGETMALRDAGRVAKLRGQGPVDFRETMMFTTLTPCVVCCAQITNRCNFEKVFIGDITNAPSTAPILREGGITNIEILEDPMAIALYKEYSEKRPDLHFIDWAGHKKLDEAKAKGWM